VFLSSSSAGIGAFSMTELDDASRISRSLTCSACWVETTTASTRTGLPSVLDGDLGLAVGAEPVERAVAAHVGELLGEAVRVVDAHRHQLGVSLQA
jgi:hypothetical protein